MKQRGIATCVEKAWCTQGREGVKRGTTPVVTERVRKLLRIEGIAGCSDAKECVIS